MARCILLSLFALALQAQPDGDVLLKQTEAALQKGDYAAAMESGAGALRAFAIDSLWAANAGVATTPTAMVAAQNRETVKIFMADGQWRFAASVASWRINAVSDETSDET